MNFSKISYQLILAKYIDTWGGFINFAAYLSSRRICTLNVFSTFELKNDKILRQSDATSSYCYMLQMNPPLNKVVKVMVDQPRLTSWLGCDEMSENLCDLDLHFNVYSHPHPFRLYLSIVSNAHVHMK